MRLNPNQTAVLIVDVQSALFGSEPGPFEGPATLRAMNDVAARARQAGAPVFIVQHDGSTEDDLVPDTAGWRLHAGLITQAGDVYLRKTTCDAFYGTPLETELRQRGINTLVLMGYATDFCIDSTLRNAVSKEFAVVVVADGHTTHDGPGLGAGAVREHHNWAWANCTTCRPVTVVPGGELQFQAS